MKYPNAANGVKKIFTSEILALIATLSAGISLLMGLLVVESAENISGGVVTDVNATGVLAGGAGFVIFALGAAVLIIIALIINLVGLNKASKDEENSSNFKTALFLIVVSIALSIAGSALSTSNPGLYKWLSVGSELANLIATYFTLEGVAVISDQIGNAELAGKARKLIIAIMCLHLFGLIAERIPDLLSAGTLGKALAVGLAVVGLFLTIVSFVIYISILSKAKKAFAEA
ncbi:MAG: hypothetical protein VZQ83_01650 [Eubacterium sp.]|nr:hypothetical protein [Eubacterium sp.]